MCMRMWYGVPSPSCKPGASRGRAAVAPRVGLRANPTPPSISLGVLSAPGQPRKTEAKLAHHVVERLPELDQAIDELRVGLARVVHDQQVALCRIGKQIVRQTHSSLQARRVSTEGRVLVASPRPSAKLIAADCS